MPRVTSRPHTFSLVGRGALVPTVAPLELPFSARDEGADRRRSSSSQVGQRWPGRRVESADQVAGGRLLSAFRGRRLAASLESIPLLQAARMA
jgi:hypothetical protein